MDLRRLREQADLANARARATLTHDSENKRSEAQAREKALAEARAERINKIISRIEITAEHASRRGEHQARLMYIAQGGVRGWERKTSVSFWSNRIKENSPYVKFSQVISPVARCVYEHCERIGVKPRVRWNRFNTGTLGPGDIGDRIQDLESSGHADLFELIIQW
jgi:hypothetical protein